MRELDGTGVAATVVVVFAIDIGPTSRSHTSSTFKARDVVRSVGFAIAVPFAVADAGMDCVRFCAAAVTASTKTRDMNMAAISAKA